MRVRGRPGGLPRPAGGPRRCVQPALGVPAGGAGRPGVPAHRAAQGGGPQGAPRAPHALPGGPQAEPSAGAARAERAGGPGAAAGGVLGVPARAVRAVERPRPGRDGGDLPAGGDLRPAEPAAEGEERVPGGQNLGRAPPPGGGGPGRAAAAGEEARRGGGGRAAPPGQRVGAGARGLLGAFSAAQPRAAGRDLGHARADEKACDIGRAAALERGAQAGGAGGHGRGSGPPGRNRHQAGGTAMDDGSAGHAALDHERCDDGLLQHTEGTSAEDSRGGLGFRATVSGESAPEQPLPGPRAAGDHAPRQEVHVGGCGPGRRHGGLHAHPARRHVDGGFTHSGRCNGAGPGGLIHLGMLEPRIRSKESRPPRDGCPVNYSRSEA
mmetsp:Transcript_9704/g.27242  ORF Transcript_9704/g.27242 Transcript_9704/m.27242 type:complete len:381 (+) Transcript_9704:154-1296(+)